MHTKSVLSVLRARETTLNAKIMSAENKRSLDQLMAVEIYLLKFCDKILRGAYNALWLLRLLKTSIMVTRTPLTTIKCMPRALTR